MLTRNSIPLDLMPSTEREAYGHRYLEIRYVTIEGAGGSTRRWSFELVGWLQANDGALIVGLREI